MQGLALADSLRGREPIHHGHLDVHQRQVEGPALVRLDGFLPVEGDDRDVPHLFQEPHDHALVDRVVFRHQDMQAPGRSIAPDGHERRGRVDRLTEGEEHGAEQLRRREGLDQVTGDTKRATAREIAAHHVRGQQHDRHTGQRGLPADALGNGEAVEVGHPRIEQHQLEGAPSGARALELGQRHAPVLDDRRGRAPRGQHRLEQPSVGRVVVGGQDRKSPERVRRRRHPLGDRHSRPLEHQGEVEGAAAIELAVEPDAPAHPLDQPATDGETKPGPAESARRRGVRLSEGVEDEPALVGRDPDARVLHGHAQGYVLGGHGLGVDANGDFALLGELDRVADQIDEDLADPPGIADEVVRDTRTNLVRELERLGVGERRERLDRLGQGLPQGEGHRLELEPTGLDLRKVEDVVDDGEQGLARAVDGFGVVALLARELGVQQERGHADHAVHRRPDLVAHRRQEL